MTRPVPARFALLLGALVLRAAAVEPAPTAPLEESKKALRELQQRQATRDAAASSIKLGEALPKLQTPSAEPLDPPSPATNRESQNSQSPATKKNWLLEGMNKNGGRTGAAEDEEVIDPSNPDFLVESYKRSQAKKERLAAEEARQRPKSTEETKPANPLDGYMKDWLAGSPVDRSVFESIDHGPALRRADASGLSAKNLTDGRGDPHAMDLRTSGDVVPTTKDNPYLASLSSASPTGAGNFQGQAASGFRPSPPPSAPNPLPPSAQVPSAPPPIPKPLPKPPVSQRDEDRKYFPQLKRF